MTSVQFIGNSYVVLLCDNIADMLLEVAGLRCSHRYKYILVCKVLKWNLSIHYYISLY